MGFSVLVSLAVLVFRDRASLCSLGYLSTHYEAQAWCLILDNPPASGSSV